ncbi:MAG: universal stress protein [Thermodesulforhabdaceae bacterium]
MKILFACDEHPYSNFALKEAMRLAYNTWADVTILGIIPSMPSDSTLMESHPIVRALTSYRQTFLENSPSEESPYEPKLWRYEWFPLQKGKLWEEMLIKKGAKRDLRVRIRAGNEADEIIEEAQEEGSDLIVIGCTGGSQCIWQNAPSVPQKVVNEASCSVLLVKENQPITRILACLDQSYISQDSLEMINQMATIHGASLQLIGLTQEGTMKKDVYRRLIEIGDYYEDREIPVTTQLTEITEFEGFIEKELRQDLVALWMGKKSLLDRFFPRDWVGRFVSKCQTSVLVLR